MKYKVKITIELQVEAENAEDAIIEAENVELPTGYIENSYDLLDVSKMETTTTKDYTIYSSPQLKAYISIFLYLFFIYWGFLPSIIYQNRVFFVLLL